VVALLGCATPRSDSKPAPVPVVPRPDVQRLDQVRAKSHSTAELAWVEHERLTRLAGDDLIEKHFELLRLFPNATTVEWAARISKFDVMRSGVFALCIDDLGNVASVSVMSTTGDHFFDAQAMKAIRSWKYSPFNEDGRPTSVCSFVVIRSKNGNVRRRFVPIE
jgi:TonB family protein